MNAVRPGGPEPGLPSEAAAPEWAWPPPHDDLDAIASIDVEAFVRPGAEGDAVRASVLPTQRDVFMAWSADVGVRPRRLVLVVPLAAAAMLATGLLSVRMATVPSHVPQAGPALRSRLAAPVTEPPSTTGAVSATVDAGASPASSSPSPTSGRGRPFVPADAPGLASSAHRSSELPAPLSAAAPVHPVMPLPTSMPSASPVLVMPSADDAVGALSPPEVGPADRRARTLEEPALATPEAMPRPDEEPSIREVLHRYGAAYSRLDAPAARAVWPSVDSTALTRAFSALKSQDVRLGECRVAVEGQASTASATCSGSTTWVPRIGDPAPRVETREWRFRLSKAPSAGWRIDSVRSR